MALFTKIFLPISTKKDLNPSQYLICYLIYQGEINLLYKWNYNQKYFNQPGITVEDLVDLVRKKYLFCPQKTDQNGKNLYSKNGYPIYDIENGVVAESLKEEMSEPF